ncbi:MAG: TetR/AcrR family transcriptional regulator [Ruminococcus sp.]|nr:TetR/AcrR family transcriptional regulator [Ruminococcus sp.]
MDLRTEKTRQSIINSFIELRAKKPIEKITVKELSDLARINKATFYRHYADIYSLSEEIENDLIQNCIDRITEPENILEKDAILDLAEAISSQNQLYDIIFSGSRKDAAIHKIHNFLMDKILVQHPEYQNDLEKKVILTTLIYGTFQSCQIYKDMAINRDTIINTIVKLNRVLQMPPCEK